MRQSKLLVKATDKMWLSLTTNRSLTHRNRRSSSFKTKLLICKRSSQLPWPSQISFSNSVIACVLLSKISTKLKKNYFRGSKPRWMRSEAQTEKKQFWQMTFNHIKGNSFLKTRRSTTLKCLSPSLIKIWMICRLNLMLKPKSLQQRDNVLRNKPWISVMFNTKCLWQSGKKTTFIGSCLRENKR